MHKLIDALMLIGGLGAIGLAVLMILPVGVNLPASWFGGLLIVLIAGLGAWLSYHGGKRLLRSRRSRGQAFKGSE